MTASGTVTATTTSEKDNSLTINVEHGRGQWKTYGGIENYRPGKYMIATFNKISRVGLAKFSSDRFDVYEYDTTADDQQQQQQQQQQRNVHAILIRSHKLQEHQVPHTVRAIAR
jgi:D-3-phosphoglycerate dehydrogenase